jgi:hypothetical protein
MDCVRSLQRKHSEAAVKGGGLLHCDDVKALLIYLSRKLDIKQ